MPPTMAASRRTSRCRARFGEALEARLLQLQRLTRYRPARFLGFGDDDGESRTVRVADAGGERNLRAKLLVAADGSRSSVRAALGIESDEHDYAQTLFVARVRSERLPDGTAYERFGDHGPTALLPRGDRHYGVVHGVARADAETVAALDDTAFVARVQQAFGWRVGRLLAAGPRSAYPAIRVLARRLVTHRAVLIGNAAQTLHPIGAQGFNLGLRDALTLVECIEMQRADPGSVAVLEAYAQRRRQDRERTISFSDGLARLTADTAPWLHHCAARVAGDGPGDVDAIADRRRRMGYRGDVPRLCRVERA